MLFSAFQMLTLLVGILLILGIVCTIPREYRSRKDYAICQFRAFLENEAGKTYTIQCVETVLGRNWRRADITLSDPRISRTHSSILAQKDGSFRIYNLSKKHPTVLNGRTVPPEGSILLDGDRIGLPGKTLTFRRGGIL